MMQKPLSGGRRGGITRHAVSSGWSKPSAIRCLSEASLSLGCQPEAVVSAVRCIVRRRAALMNRRETAAQLGGPADQHIRPGIRTPAALRHATLAGG
jgi:hypothetical protein